MHKTKMAENNKYKIQPYPSSSLAPPHLIERAMVQLHIQISHKA